MEEEKPEEASSRVQDVFLSEARQRLEEATRILQGPFPRPGTREISTLHRHAHALKGTAGYLNQPRVEALAKEIVEHIAPFERIADEVPEPDREIVTRDFQALVEELKRMADARVEQTRANDAGAS